MAAGIDPMAVYQKRFGRHWVEMRDGKVRLKPFHEYRSLFEEADRFVMLQAGEITLNADNGRGVHLGAINVPGCILPVKGATVREVIEGNLRAVEESGQRSGREVLVHVNHPNYQWGVTAEDLTRVLGEEFFEVWNGVVSENDPGDASHPSTDEIWDIANTIRLAGMKSGPLFGIATDDSHDYHGNKDRAVPGRAWVMVRARRLTPESLIRAMKNGDFHVSTGVTLEECRYDEASRTYALRIHPEEGETFVTRFIGTRRGVNLQGKPRRDADGKLVETTLNYSDGSGPQIGEVFAEATALNPSYVLKGDELYVRAVITSSGKTGVSSKEFAFKRAWTQPVARKSPDGHLQMPM